MSDHPRIRGEHGRLHERRQDGTGSSPHTRGARTRGSTSTGAGRIIPAYAGSTAVTTPPSRDRPDHPRIRGEHVRRQKNDPAWHGSSPHTRGAPRLCPWRCPGGWDHPRIRGEHEPPVRASGVEGGSSPHTRGARFFTIILRFFERIIPAYAGSTVRVTPAGPAAADHPRIRGEHTWKSLQYQGSPP